MPDSTERFAYDLRGWARLPGVVAPDLVARLNDALARFEGLSRDELPADVIPSWTPVINEFRILNLLECDPLFLDLVDLPEVLDWVQWLVPSPFRLVEAYSITRLAGIGVPLHAQPEAATRADASGLHSDLLKITIALGEVGTDDGPLVVFDGSHKLSGEFPFNRLHPDWRGDGTDPEVEAHFTATNADRPSVPWEQIPGYHEVLVSQGDIVVMSEDIWHGAKALNSGKRRRSLCLSYAPYHFPNWHGIPYSARLIESATPAQRQLLSGPHAGAQYELGPRSPHPAIPFQPNSSRDPRSLR